MDVASRKFNGTKLRDLRKARKWSQTQLGTRIGAHVTSVSDWERGDNEPSGRHVAGLARELDVPAESFYGNDADDEEAHVARVRRVRAALVLAGHDDLADELRRIAESRASRVSERAPERQTA